MGRRRRACCTSARRAPALMPGPACYGRGGTQATVTDACVVLGYIDPDYFLGGAMTLEPGLAAAAIATHVAEPLGLDVYEAAAAVLDLACERMVSAIEEITLNQGIDPREAVLVGGGGGAGLYSVAIARRLGAGAVVIPEVAAALSATGALLSELRRGLRRDRGHDERRVRLRACQLGARRPAPPLRRVRRHRGGR